MILADKIIEERKKNGWSQEELADRLGVSRQAVSKWESAGTVPDLQRVIQLAELFGVSTDYLLKDDMGPEMEASEPKEENGSVNLRRVSMEEANAFISVKTQGAPKIANAVTMCILSPIVLIGLAALADSQKYGISEGMAVAIGLVVLLAMVAAAVFAFITTGTQQKKYEYFEKECFETEYGVSGMVKEKHKDFEGIYTRGIALGVVLCIIAVIPLIVASCIEIEDYLCVLFVCLLLAIVSVGVNMIVRVAIIKNCYEMLLQEGEFSKEDKTAKGKMEPFSGAYWGIITVIYLAWSFKTMRWDNTWIIWPIAGVLYGAITQMIKALDKKA